MKNTIFIKYTNIYIYMYENNLRGYMRKKKLRHVYYRLLLF